MAVFASDKWFAGESAVAFLIEMFLVVISGNIHRVQEAQARRQLRESSSQGDRTGLIIFFHDFGQFLCEHSQASGIRPLGVILPFLRRFIRIIVACHGGERGVAVRVIGVVNLIADTPHDNRGMAAVTAHKCCQILFMPLGKLQIVALVLWGIHIVSGAPFVFGAFPLVKCFIYDKKTHRIAEVIKFRHMGIVAHPYGIASHIL